MIAVLRYAIVIKTNERMIAIGIFFFGFLASSPVDATESNPM